MNTWLISLVLVGGGVFSTLHYVADVGTGWSVTLGIVGFLASQVLISLAFRKRLMADMQSVQKILTEGQRKIQAKMARWQIRPPGSVQAAQREIMEDTKVFVKEALDETEKLRKYRYWVPMIERQIATAQIQLCWMIKDFKKVDQLMPKAILLEPTMAAMKLARMQMLNEPEAEIAKVYNKAVARVRYNQNVLLAATYSWILVKRNKIDDAFKALTEALKKSDDETLKRNHENLMNNRIAHFNNSGLGDQWYALHLEEPKVHTQRQRPIYR